MDMEIWPKDTHRERARSNKTPVLTKSMNMVTWVVDTWNQLYKMFLNWNKIFKKNGVVTGETLFFISIALTLVSDRAVLYQNIAFPILGLSTKKQYSNVLKKLFIFQKICFKVKVLKMFKISSDCHIKTCRSLKRRPILEIPSAIFRRRYALSVSFKLKPLRKSIFLC